MRNFFSYSIVELRRDHGRGALVGPFIFAIILAFIAGFVHAPTWVGVAILAFIVLSGAYLTHLFINLFKKSLK